MGEFDVAQICLNGHVVNSLWLNAPAYNQDYCDRCGERTIVRCQHCNEPIRGDHCTDLGNVDMALGGVPPAYCHSCGKPFPWTDRAIQTAIELANESGCLSEEEASIFRESLDDIVQDSPRTKLGAVRLKKLLAKLGRETGNAIRGVLVEVASEAAKKAIWPDQ